MTEPRPSVRLASIVGALASLLVPAVVFADDEPAPSPSEEGSATVMGSSRTDRIPGTASLLRREDLRLLAPQHGGDALRTVPGLNIVAEDGIGLRLNIGIRGLDPNRSRKVLILEDGIPVSLNPYGSPELYYTPPIERMERIEVVRGSGQILWGPQTIGGVINYITRDPPLRPSGFVDVRYGTGEYFMTHAGAGATHGQVGWSVDMIHRRFDGPRSLGLSLTDVTARLRIGFGPRSVFRVKFNLYDESSRATYLGLTTAQFANTPELNLASNDQFVVRRHAIALVHQFRFSDTVRLQTNLYGYETNRAWRRQDFEREDRGNDYERVCDGQGVCRDPGDPAIIDGPRGTNVYFRNTAAIRNRRFEVAGFEPRLTWNWARSPNFQGEFIAVARALYERAHEQILITSIPTALSGDPHDEERRTGYALAGAVQNRFTFFRRLHVTPGLRLESYTSRRQIVRVPTTNAAMMRVGSDVNIEGTANTVALIPGLGVAVDVARGFNVYTGAHRGYAPPRSKDAVSATGTNLQLDAELSWNFELGARYRAGRWLSLEAAGFLMEFDNQIIPPSEAGATVSGGDFNTGRSRHAGLEASAMIDLAGRVPGSSFRLPVIVNYTWLPVAAFTAGAFDGNRLPYAPEHLLNLQVRFIHRAGIAAQVGFNLNSSQFADRENTSFPSADGLVGAIPTWMTLDARVAYTFRRQGVTVSVNGRNLTNQIYIASRAPQGIQPAGYRQVFAAIEWAWPSS